ncbi:6df8c093-b133-4d41-bb84-b1d7b3d7526e [Sclerotinia trifoliorum]|uniref:6df8c093-b133-4d41-bb84-b1d7b3d7526e n=1 Tax=Sclerotinia trifoliorum TaxID=28548 RepID=A0A8H2W3U5_9HELO|nr:6df8c093-b133-4d41-bb84-b1d7b3d7526e [Sclerotinia trifoliorum]
MNYSLSSHTATLRPTTSSLVGSLISLPAATAIVTATATATTTATATAEILLPIDTNTTSDHSHRDITNYFITKMSTWLGLAFTLIYIAILIIRVYKEIKCCLEISIPKYRNKNPRENSEEGGVKDHKSTVGSQICEEKYQNDASGMTGIRTPKQDSVNAIDSRNMVQSSEEYYDTKKNEYLAYLQGTLKTPWLLPSNNTVESMMEEGRCKSAPRS